MLLLQCLVTSLYLIDGHFTNESWWRCFGCGSYLGSALPSCPLIAPVPRTSAHSGPVYTLERILLCFFYSAGRVPRIILRVDFCCTRWHIPKSSFLLVPDSVPARLHKAAEGSHGEGQKLQGWHTFCFSYLSPSKYCITMESEHLTRGAS